MKSSYAQAFEAIGTHWRIEFEFDTAKTDPRMVMQKIHERIRQFDNDYSRFRSDSLVSEIARAAGTYRMPDDTEPMLRLYQDLYFLTEGAFTPLIGSVLEDAGYDADYSLTPKELRAPMDFNTAITFDAPYLIAHQPVLLDVGAAGKGYLVDIVSQILINYAVSAYVVDAGGDIAIYSKNNAPIEIGLEHPGDPTQAVGIATIESGSLCGSSGNRRAWDRFHHIIDPRALASPRDKAAVWVTAKTTMLADALSTCLYLVPPAHLKRYYSFEYLILRDDYSIERSAHFPAELFTRSSLYNYENDRILS